MPNDIFVSTGRETAANAYALSPEMAAAYDAGRVSERQRIRQLAAAFGVTITDLNSGQTVPFADLLDGPQ